jgi:hypothetical protein
MMRLVWYCSKYKLPDLVYLINLFGKIDKSMCPVEIVTEFNEHQIWNTIWPHWKKFDRKGLPRFGKRGYRWISSALFLYVGNDIEYYWLWKPFESVLKEILERGREYLVQLAELRIEKPTGVKINEETLLRVIISNPYMIKGLTGKDGKLYAHHPINGREIDLIFFAEDGEVWVFEVEVKVGRGTWGEVEFYKDLLVEKGIAEELKIKKGIICMECPEDILKTCKEREIKVITPSLKEL